MIARLRDFAAGVRRPAQAVALAGVCALWFFVLRPAPLGGPAGLVAVSGNSMKPHLESGDLVLTYRQPTYRRGDVVAFRVPKGQPDAGSLVIHRIIGGSGTTGYRTQGDNRSSPDPWRPRPDDITGRAVVQAPHVAKVLPLIQKPAVLAALAAVLAFFTVRWPTSRRTASP